MDKLVAARLRGVGIVVVNYFDEFIEGLVVEGGKRRFNGGVEECFVLEQGEVGELDAQLFVKGAHLDAVYNGVGKLGEGACAYNAFFYPEGFGNNGGYPVAQGRLDIGDGGLANLAELFVEVFAVVKHS